MNNGMFNTSVTLMQDAPNKTLAIPYASNFPQISVPPPYSVTLTLGNLGEVFYLQT
jgi:hypothetical protein